MGRTRVERAIALLKKEIESAKVGKKRILNYVEKIKNKCLDKEITYYEYEHFIHKKYDGKTIQQWLDYYDKIIHANEKKIGREIQKTIIQRVLLICSLVSLLLFSLFFMKPLYSFGKEFATTITGFAIADNETISQLPELQPELQNESPEFSEDKPEAPQYTSPSQEEPLPSSEELLEIPQIIPGEEETIEENISEIEEEKIKKEINISTKQYKAVINQPVKWIKTIKLNNLTQAENLTIELPKEAENISIKTGEEAREVINVFRLETEQVGSGITGAVISDVSPSTPLKAINFFLQFLKQLFKKLTITGKVIEVTDADNIVVETEENKIISLEPIITETQATEIVVEYYTEGPTAIEEETATGKTVFISSVEELNYTDILAYTYIPELFDNEQKNNIKIFWREENIFIDFNAEDTDENGKIDYLEWNIPHLSGQTFDIIFISKAEHLDENKKFIKNIYEQVKDLDGNWSETIPDRHYVRATFEKNLTNKNDITLFPRIISGNPRIEVYEFNSSEKIAEFTDIISNEYNKVLLTNLGQGQCYDNETEILTENGWKLFNELSNEKVATLNQKTGDIEWQIPLEKQEFNNTNGELYLIILEDGSELRVNEKHKVYVSSEISNLSSYKTINLPSNSSVLVFDLSNLENDSVNTSTGLSCGTLNQTTENIFSLVNLSESVKSSSLLINTLSSDLENSANFPLDKPFGFETTSTPSCLRNFSNLLSTFSSSRNLTIEWNTELDIISAPHEISCILQGCFNMLISQGREGFKDFIDRDISLEHFQNLPNHNSCSYESRLSVTNFSVCNNILINFDSHKNVNEQEVFKDFQLMLITDAYSVLHDGAELYFLDSNNKPVKIKSIAKVAYNDKIYGVDVENDIVLVRRKNSTPVWSGNSEGYSQDSFDLRIVDGSIEFDHIVDPVTTPAVIFVDPSPANATSNGNFSVSFNVSIEIGNLSDVRWNWNGTNFTLYNQSLVLYFNFDNRTSLGENDTYIADVSRGGNNGTAVGNPKVNVSGKYDKAITFDGINDGITILDKNNLDLNNLTISVWVSLAQNPSVTGIQQSIISKYSNSSGGGTYFMRISEVSDSFEAGIFKSITGEQSVSDPINLTNNFSSWNHFILTYNNTQLVLYRNGVRITSNNVTDILDVSADNLFIGNSDGGGNGFFNGSIDEIRIYNVTFNDSEAYYLYASNLYKFNETQWYLLLNQSLNASTRLINGSYTYYAWAKDVNGNENRTEMRFINISSAGNSAPEIRYVDNATMTNVAGGLSAGPLNTSIIINFSAYDADGANNLNNLSARINFTRGGESVRQNASCTPITTASNYINYSCNITMMWFDAAGAWNIAAYINDTSGSAVVNISMNFSVGETVGFQAGSLTWAALGVGTTNRTSAINLTLNNTGNKAIPVNATEINASNLDGETNSALSIFAANISASWDATGLSSCIGTGSNETKATNLSATQTDNWVNITMANLTRGNYFTNDGNTGQEIYYFCIKTVGAELTSQSYSTLNEGQWIIRILLVGIAFRRRKKKKLTDSKIKDVLQQTFESLQKKYSLTAKEITAMAIKQLQENYNISEKEVTAILEEKELVIPITIFSKRLGALESLVKYLKENMNMSYHEIAQKLGRDDRTIWTAYKKAVKKHKEKIAAKETPILLPIELFNTSLTVLESAIIFLKEKGMKFSEVAGLLQRDQRNIWTIYTRAKKKLSDKNN